MQIENEYLIKFGDSQTSAVLKKIGNKQECQRQLDIISKYMEAPSHTSITIKRKLPQEDNELAKRSKDLSDEFCQNKILKNKIAELKCELVRLNNLVKVLENQVEQKNHLIECHKNTYN